MSLPGVDFADLTSPEPARHASALEALRDAVLRWGAFGIDGASLPASIVPRALQAGRDHFALPLETKLRARASGGRPDGYHPNPGHGDQREKLMRTYGRMGDLTTSAWPDDIAALAPATDALVESLEPVSIALIRGLCELLGAPPDALDDAFVGRGARATWHLQYAAVPSQGGRPGQGTSAHTDFAPLGIIVQDAVGGLEVRDADGAWHRTDPARWPLVCLVGDLFERWSNDRVRASVHRVVSDPVRARSSILVSVLPEWEAVVAPLAACVSEAHPARYAPITFGAALERWAAALETGEAGHVPDDALRR